VPKKNQSTEETIAAVLRLENRCDLWWKNCDLFDREWNLAAWQGLTACAKSLETGLSSQERGGPKHQLTATNLSRIAYELYKAAKQHGVKRVAPLSRMRSILPDKMMDHAVEQAHAYSMCCADFPGWHRNLYSVSELTDTSVKFTSENSGRAERVLAYEKGFRPQALRIDKSKKDGTVHEDKLAHLIPGIVSAIKPRGKSGFDLPNLDEMHKALVSEYLLRLDKLYRRLETIELGGYTMAEFRRFVAGLLAIAGTREYLCYVWRATGHSLPTDDLLIVSSRSKWIESLSSLTTLSPNIVSSMISDLTLKIDQSNCDVNVAPFLPLDDTPNWLCVVPGFLMIVNSEESILRNRTSYNKKFADEASLSKEDEARQELKKALPNLSIMGPFLLRKSMPDIDLVIEDSVSNSILIAELKWLQFPLLVRGREGRDEELKKGTRQIDFIRGFLSANPGYLVRNGGINKSLNDYAEVHYCVLCRDYIIHIDGARLYSYSALKAKLEDGATLSEAIDFMAKDEWLPAPPRDYTIDYQSYLCNGISITTKIFRANYEAPLNLLGG
jgi:hypothetical protein